MIRLVSIFVATLVAFAFLMIGVSAAVASGVDLIWVDGNPHEATKISGPTLHFETPEAWPTAAYTVRNVWAGNGSENLPCPGGIHWIDNKNVLTISNCLEVPSSTTTTIPNTSTTTTVPASTTTTTVNPTTTTTIPSTTTSTLPGETTTTVGVDCCLDPSCETVPTLCPPELPKTGAQLLYLFIIGAGLVLTGALLLRYGSDE